MSEDVRKDVIDYVMRLIDFGKGRPDAEFEDSTLGQVADRIIALSTSEPGLRVEIKERLEQPTTCKVWRGDVLVFDGVDRSALIHKEEKV